MFIKRQLITSSIYINYELKWKQMRFDVDDNFDVCFSVVFEKSGGFIRFNLYFDCCLTINNKFIPASPTCRVHGEKNMFWTHPDYIILLQIISLWCELVRRKHTYRIRINHIEIWSNYFAIMVYKKHADVSLLFWIFSPLLQNSYFIFQYYLSLFYRYVSFVTIHHKEIICRRRCFSIIYFYLLDMFHLHQFIYEIISANYSTNINQFHYEQSPLSRQIW